jgi:hypothetical protein
LEHPNQKSLLVVVPLSIAEQYEQSIIEYTTVITNAINKALEVYQEEIRKHLDKKLDELKGMTD